MRGDRFGSTLDLSGNVAIVGAPRDDDHGIQYGLVYLYDVTTGDELFQLYPDGAVGNEGVGRAVAIDGDKALVGALAHELTFDNHGAVYVFDVATGEQLHKLTPNDITDAIRFGGSVAADSGRALVGNLFSGYLFDLDTGDQILELSSPGLTFEVGDIDGNLAIFGDPYVDIGGQFEAGIAHVYDLTTGEQLWQLQADDPQLFGRFGYSVAIGGNRAVIGAENFSGISAAYVFDLTTGEQLYKFTPADGVVYHGNFGNRLAIEGDLALVGTFPEEDAAGTAYLFDLNTGELLTRINTPPGPAVGSVGFGEGYSTVALDGTTALIGAQGQNKKDAASGAAYVYDIPEPVTAVLLLAGLVGITPRRG